MLLKYISKLNNYLILWEMLSHKYYYMTLYTKALYTLRKEF